MTNVIELSPAELEMIKLKREQAALAEKEAEAKKALELEKNIKAKQDIIAANKKKDQEQIAAARKYLLDFDTTQYSLDINTRHETVQVTGDYIDKFFNRNILWSEVYGRQWAVISHKNGQKVKVDEQIVYSYGWRTKGESKGYKMYISGPGIEYKQEGQALSRVKSVMKKIKAANEVIESKRKHEENKKNALRVTVDRFKAEYPDAEVTTDYSYDKVYGSSRSYSSGERYDIVRTKFVNGANIVYRVYANGSLSRVSFNLPSAKDEASFMKNLSQMKF